MIELVVLLLLLGVGVALIRNRPQPLANEVDPEGELRAAAELHKIRRRLDVAWSRTEMRRDSARLRREIASALEDEEPPGR